MSGLKVRRLDSPLARAQPPRGPDPSSAGTEVPAPPLVDVGEGAERPLRVAPVAAPTTTEAAPVPVLAEPPAMEESLELLSTRLPTSLRRNLSELTAALRARNGVVSQKGLPEQEVLALLIWAAGSPEDPESVERLDGLLSEFRARRYAAAAQALRSGQV